MKHSADISKNVMKKVVQYEEQRAHRWIIWFVVVLMALGASLIASVYFIYRDFVEYQTFALFSLFFQDWEIISEYWQDTISTIWEESPQYLIIFGLCICAIIVCYLAVTKRKRKLLQKKMEQVSHYRKHQPT